MKLLKFKGRVFKITKVTDETVNFDLVNDADKGLIKLESSTLKYTEHMGDEEYAAQEEKARFTAYYTGDYGGEFTGCLLDEFDLENMTASISYKKHFVYTSKDMAEDKFKFTEEELTYGESLTSVSRYNL